MYAISRQTCHDSSKILTLIIDLLTIVNQGKIWFGRKTDDVLNHYLNSEQQQQKKVT